MKTDITEKVPDDFPSRVKRFFVDGPAGKLDTVFDVGQGGTGNRCAVICHPHPLHGGSMRNKVVTIVARSLRELGWHTLCFNFRGVGDSQGCFDDGVGELGDLHAVMDWANRRHAGSVTCLAGFSFGSFVAARAAGKAGVPDLISIAPPVEHCDFTAVQRPSGRWLVVQGEADEVVTPQAVYQWAARVDPPVKLVKMPGAGHFFHRRLMDLRAVLHAEWALEP